MKWIQAFQSIEPRKSRARRQARAPGKFRISPEGGMATTRITVRNDGSLRVEGDFEITDQDGKVFGLNGRTKIGLCRCGHSATKPFCDGAHHKMGFKNTVLAYDLPPVPPAPKP
jgi:CDGSH-type Zn-finger protein